MVWLPEIYRRTVVPALVAIALLSAASIIILQLGQLPRMMTVEPQIVLDVVTVLLAGVPSLSVFGETPRASGFGL